MRKGVIPQAVKLVTEGIIEEKSGFALISSDGTSARAQDEFVVEVTMLSEEENKQPEVTRPSVPTDSVFSSTMVPGGKT